MRPPLKVFLQTIATSNKPDIVSAAEWLNNQNLTKGEWDEIVRPLIEAYGFENERALEKALKRPSELYEDDFTPLLEEIGLEGWLKAYVEHTRGMEAPTAFHFFTGLVLIAASLKRQILLNMGYFQVYPATQILLVGPSGKVKKSTAAEYGVTLALKAQGDLFNLLPDEGSGEGLKVALSAKSQSTGESTGLLFISELSTFLGKQDYNVGLVQTLTDLFDSREYKCRRTTGRGEQPMENIALSALWCSNEQWLADAIPDSAFGGGLFGRMLVIYQPDTDRVFHYPKIQPEERDELQAELLRVQFVRGSCLLTPEAHKWDESQYMARKNQWPDDERIHPFWDRYHMHLLKMAMVLSVSDDLNQRDTIILAEKHLRQADSLLKWHLRYLPKVYAHLGGTRYGVEHAKILKIIDSKAGKVIEENELGRKMASRMGRKTLEEHLYTMVRNGVIRKVKMDWDNNKYGWKIKGGLG
jgi:hypothetical protein